jgi:hypothetical protein
MHCNTNASAGNDTENFKSDDAVYQSLPQCSYYHNS